MKKKIDSTQKVLEELNLATNIKNNNNSSNKSDNKSSIKNSAKKLDKNKISGDNPLGKNKKTNNNLEFKDKQNNSNRTKLNLKNKKLFIVFMFLNIALISALIAIIVFQNMQLKQYESNVNITKPISINLVENNGSVATLKLPAHVVGELQLNQNIKYNNNTNNNKLVLRSKLIGCEKNFENFNVQAVVNDNWLIGEDGYYYYNKVLNSNTEYEFCSGIILPKFDKSNTNEKTIVVMFETLDINKNAVNKKWNTAPIDWFSLIIAS